MPDIIKRNKALSVSPLKASQSIGAALAFLGFRHAMPMLHGSQGCTAFGKVFFVRHFREPVPLQTTAMDQVSTVMGSENSVIEGLKTIAQKNNPALIGLPTTGLSETQGSDVTMAVQEFRKQYPQFKAISVVPVATPDYSGCLESGFARAVEAIIDTLVPDTESRNEKKSGKQHPQVNVLAGSFLTPGDLEEVKEIIEAFGLHPLVIPDLSDSLDGHLDSNDFSALTTGGTEVAELQNLDDAVATLVIGASLNKAADKLKQRTGVMDYRFEHLMGLEATDQLVQCLHEISAQPVPYKLERQRAQLQDSMLDTHFMLGMSRFAIAADPDLLVALSQMLAGVGGEVVAAVSAINAPVLKQVMAKSVKIGDLEDLEHMARENNAELLITNSHGLESSKRLGIPLLRAGFPQFDNLGGYQKTWVGYRGSRQILFELANMLLTLDKGEIQPYQSVYTQKTDFREHLL